MNLNIVMTSGFTIVSILIWQRLVQLWSEIWSSYNIMWWTMHWYHLQIYMHFYKLFFSKLDADTIISNVANVFQKAWSSLYVCPAPSKIYCHRVEASNKNPLKITFFRLKHLLTIKWCWKQNKKTVSSSWLYFYFTGS